MKKILLVCNAGMSTSMLVQRMEKYANENSIDIIVEAVPLTKGEACAKEWDIVMLGPQVRHCLSQLEKKLKGTVPVVVIDMKDYGLMNGENVVKAALKVLEAD